jgi:hypothetical protein
MTRTNQRRTAWAALLSLPGALLLAAVSANAAQATPTPVVAQASAASVTATATTPPPGSRLIETLTAAKKTALVTGPPSIHCEVYSSGLYILQPGAKWGPFTAFAANSTALAATAWATCSYPVTEIAVSASLDGTGEIPGDVPSGYISYSYNSQVSATNYVLRYECWPEFWQTVGDATITFPPGYIQQNPIETKSLGVRIPAADCTPEP